MLRRVMVLLAASMAALGVAACGSSGSGASGSGISGGHAASSDPATLLRQTFSASHTVKSGVLDVSLVVTTKGSSEITTPLSLSLSGPFQSRSKGQTPESSFTVAFSGLGKKGTLGVTTTASGAYLNLSGTNYALPAADFDKLKSTLGTGSGSSSTPGLSSLGINPETWLSHPQIVGTATVDGVVTEHLHASVDVAAFVASLNKVLAKESSALSSTTKVPTHISAADAAKIASVIRNPSVDVWTGKNDSILRRLEISADIPVHGSIASELGGLRSASFRLTLNYAQLGKPQTIATPTNVHSYSELESKLESIGSGLSGLGSLGSGSSSSSSASGAGAAGASSAAVAKYAKCVDGAAGDVAKIQRCAKLLNGH